MARVHSLAGVLLCLALSSLAGAAEFQLRAATALNYDTVGEDLSDRASYRLSTPVELRTSPHERYSGQINYRPEFEVDITNDGRVNWNHVMTANGGFSISPRSQVGAQIDYSDIGFLANNAQTAPDGTFDTLPRIRRSLVTLDYQYRLTPRASLKADFFYTSAMFGGFQRNDSQTIGGNVDVTYQVWKADLIAGGVQATHSLFDASVNAQGQDVTNLRFYASVKHDFTKDLSVRLNGGPTVSLFQPQAFPEVPTVQYPRTSQTSPFLKFDPQCSTRPFFAVCPQVPANVGPATFAPLTEQEARDARKFVPIPGRRRSETKVNFFGGISVAYTQARWDFVLGFRRTQSNDSGLGTSTALNALRLSVNWDASSRWDVRLAGAVSQRQSLTENVRPIDDVFIERGPFDLDGDPVAETRSIASVVNRRPVDIKQASLRIDAIRTVNRKLRLTGSALYIYDDQNRNDVRFGGNRFRLEIVLQYSFDPVHL